MKTPPGAAARAGGGEAVPVFVMKAHPSPALSVIIPSRDGSCAGNVPRLLEAVGRQERAGEAEVLLVVGERPNGHAG